jgi:inner membrane protein
MRNSATARLVVMGGLALALSVPLAWVYSIVSERATRREAAVHEVSSTWGGPQIVSGPVLAVPYTIAWIDGNGRPQRSVNRAFVLPRDLQVDGQLATEKRKRGIFEVAVYRATLKVTGKFVRPDLAWIRPAPEHVDWDQAVVLVGITDPRGVARRAALNWRGQSLPFTGGVGDAGLFRSGLHTSVPPLDETAAGVELPFDFSLELNGTRDLEFLPAAEETAVSLTSSWPHPSFAGTALPDTRTVEGRGFSAHWRVQDFGDGRAPIPIANNWRRRRPTRRSASASSSLSTSISRPSAR